MEKRRRITRTIFILLALALAGTALGILGLRMVVRHRVESWQQPVNDQGIAVDMLENPYFMEKQPGFYYRGTETVTYYSKVTDTYRHAMVYLPADYSPSREYPVLYLLHGMGGSHNTWRNKNADIILQNLYYFQDVTEMIVVCPNSNVNEEESTDRSDLPGLVEAFDRTEEDLIQDLMPYIEKNYSAKTGRENTAIAGNSMGGRNALAIGFKHQDLFGYIGAFSSANVVGDLDSGSVLPPLIDSLEVDEAAGDYPMIMLAVGNADDVCGYVSYDLDAYMNEKGIPHIFYDTDGGHQNTVWQNALYNFAQRIF